MSFHMGEINKGNSRQLESLCFSQRLSADIWIPGWFGLERAFKTIQFQLPVMGRARTRLLKAQPNLFCFKNW